MTSVGRNALRICIICVRALNIPADLKELWIVLFFNRRPHPAWRRDIPTQQQTAGNSHDADTRWLQATNFCFCHGTSFVAVNLKLCSQKSPISPEVISKASHVCMVVGASSYLAQWRQTNAVVVSEFPHLNSLLSHNFAHAPPPNTHTFYAHVIPPLPLHPASVTTHPDLWSVSS